MRAHLRSWFVVLTLAMAAFRGPRGGRQTSDAPTPKTVYLQYREPNTLRMPTNSAPILRGS